LRRKLPLPDDCFDAVYANHVIEHLTPAEGERFTAELWRVLKPGGICRMVTPDLESVCQEYLQRLQQAADNPSERNLHCYQLSLLNLIDQMVRDVPGGLLLPILQSGRFDEECVRSLWGDIFARYYPNAPRRTLSQKIASHSPKELFFIAWRRLQLFVWRKDPRRTREANKWMYDRLSLQRLMEKSKFVDIVVKDYASSDIPDWSQYDFDRSSEGDYPFEPSVYVEGRKQ
jgi:SAM-dependent methyltransferase